MRLMLVVALACAALGCSKCSSDKATPDAAVSVAAVVVDAGAAPAVEAEAPADSGFDEATLIAAFAKDCRFAPPESYYEYDQDLRGDECIAINIDQSCAPDLFDCYSKNETCRKECGTTCQSCAETCGGACDTCRADCEKLQAGKREACVTSCARVRLECRNTCMAARKACLETSCPTLESTCEDEGERKRKKACPDCAELGTCMWEDGFKDDHAKCLERYPENAKECLEWCFQE